MFIRKILKIPSWHFRKSCAVLITEYCKCVFCFLLALIQKSLREARKTGRGKQDKIKNDIEQRKECCGWGEGGREGGVSGGVFPTL